jgi:hypothetical protein
MKIDLKTVVTLLTMAALLGGFYYTTNMRLDSLEQQVSSLKESNVKLRKLINKKHR